MQACRNAVLMFQTCRTTNMWPRHYPIIWNKRITLSKQVDHHHHHHHSQTKPEAVFFEIFAGCGQLSPSMRSRGFHVVPVDYHMNKHVSRVELLSLDLTSTDGQSCLLSLLQELKPAAIHVALPLNPKVAL